VRHSTTTAATVNPNFYPHGAGFFREEAVQVTLLVILLCRARNPRPD